MYRNVGSLYLAVGKAISKWVTICIVSYKWRLCDPYWACDAVNQTVTDDIENNNNF